MVTVTRKVRLSAEEIATYREQGLVVPDYRIPEAMLDKMREAVDRLIASNPDVRPEQLTGAHNPFGQSARVIGSREFLNFAFFDEVIEMVAQLIGEDVILWGSHLFCKKAGDGMAVPWHQDGQYWPLQPLETVTVRLAIDDSLPENGCMKYIPGSHRDRRLREHRLLDRDDVAVRQEVTVDESQAASCVMQAGQISLHDVYLLHGSDANRSNLRRADYAIRYMPGRVHYNRDPEFPPNRMARLHSPLQNYTERPLWLVRGVDRGHNMRLITDYRPAVAAG